MGLPVGRIVAAAGRAVAIVAVAAGVLAAHAPGLIWYWARRDRAGRLAHLGRAAAVAAELLGPVFIKCAQIASYREDLFPAALLAPLRRLQDRAKPLGRRAAARLLDRTLGPRPGAALASVDDLPLASGSVAVVFRATTRDGRPCAVKIVRPGVRRRIDRDLACLGWIVAMLQETRAASGIPIVRTFGMIARIVAAQSDMRAEAANLVVFEAMLRTRDAIRVPMPSGEFVSEDVLVMELVEGACPLMSPDLPPERFRAASRQILDTLYLMIFTGSIVHCDMHPGNLLVERRGGTVLLDAGLVAELGPTDRRGFRDLFLGLAFNDPPACRSAILMTAMAMPERLDLRTFDRDVETLVRAYHGRTVGDFLVGEFVHEIFRLQRRHRIFVAPGFATAIWALVMFEGLVRRNYPDLDFQAAARPFVTAAIIDGVRRLVPAGAPAPVSPGVRVFSTLPAPS